DNMNATCELREHMEASSAKEGDEKRDDLVKIVVGGAGINGMEYVGKLAKRAPELCKQYNVLREKGRIICLEAAKAALPGFDTALV
ncbi:FAD-dependent oxidoreductase, partial [Bacillus thuringiensis]|nr:FAD-dependent oxidoreductase [Bacillus thuringiensis]